LFASLVNPEDVLLLDFSVEPADKDCSGDWTVKPLRFQLIIANEKIIATTLPTRMPTCRFTKGLFIRKLTANVRWDIVAIAPHRAIFAIAIYCGANGIAPDVAATALTCCPY
jgi:hypothetical protein